MKSEPVNKSFMCSWKLSVVTNHLYGRRYSRNRVYGGQLGTLPMWFLFCSAHSLYPFKGSRDVLRSSDYQLRSFVFRLYTYRLDWRNVLSEKFISTSDSFLNCDVFLEEIPENIPWNGTTVGHLSVWEMSSETAPLKMPATDAGETSGTHNLSPEETMYIDAGRESLILKVTITRNSD